MKKALFTAAALICVLVLTAGCSLGAPTMEAPSAAVVTNEAAPETAQPAQEETASPEAQEPQSEASGYDVILARYADAENNDFYIDMEPAERDAALGGYVAEELAIAAQKVYYALCDIDGDGSEELVIGGSPDETEPAKYDLLANIGGSAERLFDMEFGYRVNFEIFANGTIEVSWSNSAFESGVDFYTLKDGKAEVLTSITITSSEDDPNTMVYKRDGSEISEDDYTNALNELESSGSLALSWKAVQ